jgi:periplasmic divalent cation tolerance protein
VEWLLLMKTTEERMRALQDRLVSVHPYEIPEVVAVRIEAGFPRYLDWIAASTS